MNDMRKENWKVEWFDPRELTVAPTNNRLEPITDKEKEMMALSVMTVGIKDPLILNTEKQIVSGGLRWQGALATGFTIVPCIVKKFNSKFEERITSMLQDDLHHPLTDRAKAEFVKKCTEEDGETIESIAASLGRTPQTIRQWTMYDVYPEQIKDKPVLKQTYLEIPRKKKIAVHRILKTPQFKNDVKKSTDLVEMARESTLFDLESMSKDAHSGLYIDLNFQKWLNNQETALLETKIPKRLDMLFREKLRIEKKDFSKTIIGLIQKYVDED